MVRYLVDHGADLNLQDKVPVRPYVVVMGMPVVVVLCECRLLVVCDVLPCNNSPDIRDPIPVDVRPRPCC